jgi:cation transport ATPase
VSAIIDGVPITVGRRSFLAEQGTPPDDQLDQRARDAEQHSHTVVFVSWEGQVRGALAVGDTLKPTAPDDPRSGRR